MHTEDKEMNSYQKSRSQMRSAFLYLIKKDVDITRPSSVFRFCSAVKQPSLGSHLCAL